MCIRDRADTVVDADQKNLADKTANGFLFDSFATDDFESALARAVSVYNDHRDDWNQLIETGMNTDWSWNASAAKYIELYKQTIALKLDTHQAV